MKWKTNKMKFLISLSFIFLMLYGIGTQSNQTSALMMTTPSLNMPTTNPDAPSILQKLSQNRLNSINSDNDLFTKDNTKSPWNVESLSSPTDLNTEIEGEPTFPSTTDIGKLFEDKNGEYQKVWEPWLSKAAVRSMIASEDGNWVAVGGGYLFDNEVHIYRWNRIKKTYDHVWDSGDQVIKSDVIDLAIGDTDNNNFIEIAAASADGHVYVFEQKHLYDPITNTESMFDLVWVSPFVGPVWGVTIDDVDKDFIPDLIFGSWDGNVYWYEYIDHSGYPFSKEHWIEYREVFRYNVGERVTSLESGDIDGDGLPEVYVGLDNGTLLIFENDGVIIPINGQPFPLTQDNAYKIVYSTENIMWKPIYQISVGELDNNPNDDELAFLALGQGAYTLDYSPLDGYFVNKLIRNFETWETSGAYPLDHWVDWMINSSGANVYFFYPGIGKSYEPRDYPISMQSPYPYNTSIAQAPDGNMTTFDARSTTAWAVLNFGHYEEATGDGRIGNPLTTRGYELKFYFSDNTTIDLDNIKIEGSNDLENWYQIPKESMKATGDMGTHSYLYVDLDSFLGTYRLDKIQYLRLTFTDGIYDLDAIYTTTVYRPLDTATAISIASLDFDYQKALSGIPEPKKVIVGTSDGKLYGYAYNSTSKLFDEVWNSYDRDRFTMGTNIWTITEVKTAGKVPTWLYKENSADVINLNLGTRKLVDFTTANLVDLNAIFAKYVKVEDIPNDIVVSTDNSTLTVFTTTGATPYARSPYYTNLYFGDLNQYYALQGIDTLTATFASFSQKDDPGYGDPSYPADKKTEFPEFLLIGGLSTSGGGEFDPTPANTYTLDVWLSPGVFKKYVRAGSLETYELSGLLSAVLRLSQTVPDAAIADMDNDGYKDIVLTNGKVYLLKNLANSGFWMLQLDYFSDINTKSSTIYTSPQIVDFDGDGDKDLVLGEAGKNGARYWENIGTATKPKWVHTWNFFVRETSSLLNEDLISHFKLENYSRPNVVFDTKNKDVANFMLAYNNESNKIVRFEADYETHNSLLLGVNPKLVWLEINLKSGYNPTDGKLLNFGYHVVPVWTSESELQKWTASLSYGDLDQDGKNEIIVGDFDNNLYVFEHLTNNTYKRAFRSPDLLEYRLTDQSPYFNEQLEGISGTFYRTIWSHVTDIIAGIDMDNDGYQEIVAVGGLSIWVFEATRYDDTYRLVWTTDLYYNLFGRVANKLLGYDSISVLAAGNDLDHNGRGEFIVGLGPFMFIFEAVLNEERTDMIGFKEVFLKSDEVPTAFGRYFLPGSPFLMAFRDTLYDLKQFTYKINAIAVADLNRDGYTDIVIAGENKTRWGHVHGWAAILTNIMGTYQYKGGLEPSRMLFNPIYDLTIDDQDYDGNVELIVGHSKGVDVYEFYPSDVCVSDCSSGFDFQIVSTITGSANYPYIRPLNQMWAYAREAPQVKESDTALLELQYDTPNYDGYLNGFPAGTLIQIAVDAKSKRLVWSSSPNGGKNWTVLKPVTTMALYTGVFGNIGKKIIETQPDLYQETNGDLYVVWRAVIPGSATTDIAILIAKFNDTAYAWDTMELIKKETIVGVYDNPDPPHLLSPSIWRLPYNGSSFAVSFVNTTDDQIYIYRRYWLFGWFWWKYTTFSALDSGLNATADRFFVGKHDVIYHEETDQFVVVFSGKLYNEFKPDFDIFAAYFSFNVSAPDASTAFVLEGLSRITMDATQDLNPDLSQLYTSDKTLVVVYEALGDQPGGAIMISYSKNDTRQWREPEQLSTYPEYVAWLCAGTACIPIFQHPTEPLLRYPNILVLIRDLRFSAPSITGRAGGGFTYTFVIHQNFVHIASAFPKLATATSYIKSGYKSNDYNKNNQGNANTLTTIATTGWSAATGTTIKAKTLTVTSYATTYGVSSSYSTAAITLPATTLSSTYQLQSGGSLIQFAGTLTIPTSNIPPLAPGGFGTLMLGSQTNILVGVNPTSNWVSFDFYEAQKISVGDSDQDGRREILIGSRNRAFLAEITKTGSTEYFNSFMPMQFAEYRQTWASEEYEHRVTDVLIADGNGNNYPELVVSTEYGNVYSYELLDSAFGSAFDDIFTQPIFADSNITFSQPVSDRYSLKNRVTALVDVTGDSIPELLVGDYDPSGSEKHYIYVYSINDLNALEPFTQINAIELGNNPVLALKLAKLVGNDDVLDIIAVTSENLYVIDGVGLGVAAIIPLSTDYPSYYPIVEVYPNPLDPNTSYFFVAANNLTFFTNYTNGDMWDVPLPTVSGFATAVFAQFAFLTSTSIPNVVVGTNEGLYYIFNSTGSYTAINSTFDASSVAFSADLDNDNFEELVIASKGKLWAYDFPELTISNITELWNVSLSEYTGVPVSSDVAFQAATTNANVDTFPTTSYIVTKPARTYLNFEDGTIGSPVGVYSGVTFSNFAYEDKMFAYLPGSGQKAITSTLNGVTETNISFTTPVEYVNFYITSVANAPNDFEYIAVNFYDTNGQLLTRRYVSNDYYNPSPEQVSYMAPVGSPIKLITFERLRLSDISTIYIDDFYFGERQGSMVFAFDKANGKYLWHREFFGDTLQDLVVSDLNFDGVANELLMILDAPIFNDTFMPDTPVPYPIDAPYGVYALEDDGGILWYQTDRDLMNPFPHGIYSVVQSNKQFYDQSGYVAFGITEGGTLVAIQRITKAISTVSKTFIVRPDPSFALLGEIQTHDSILFIKSIDLTGDGTANDFVIVNARNAIIAYNGKTLEVVWKTRAPNEIISIAVGDFNNDGVQDVAYALKDSRVYALDGTTGLLLWWGAIPGFKASHALTFDLGADGYDDVLFGGSYAGYGALVALDGQGNGTGYLKIIGGYFFYKPVFDFKLIEYSGTPGVISHIAVFAKGFGVYVLRLQTSSPYFSLDSVIYSPLAQNWAVGNFYLDDNVADFALARVDVTVDVYGKVHAKLVLDGYVGNPSEWFLPINKTVSLYPSLNSAIDFDTTLLGMFVPRMTAVNIDQYSDDEVVLQTLGAQIFAVNVSENANWEIFSYEEPNVLQTFARRAIDIPGSIDINGNGIPEVIITNGHLVYGVEFAIVDPYGEQPCEVSIVWMSFTPTLSAITAIRLLDTREIGSQSLLMGSFDGRITIIDPYIFDIAISEPSYYPRPKVSSDALSSEFFVSTENDKLSTNDGFTDKLVKSENPKFKPFSSKQSATHIMEKVVVTKDSQTVDLIIPPIFLIFFAIFMTAWIQQSNNKSGDEAIHAWKRKIKASQRILFLKSLLIFFSLDIPLYLYREKKKRGFSSIHGMSLRQPMYRAYQSLSFLKGGIKR